MLPRTGLAMCLLPGRYELRPQSSQISVSTPGSKRSSTSRRSTKDRVGRLDRSRLSRCGSLPSSAASSGAFREAARSQLDRPSSRELALNDVKLEDARSRATKSLEPWTNGWKRGQREGHLCLFRKRETGLLRGWIKSCPRRPYRPNSAHRARSQRVLRWASTSTGPDAEPSGARCTTRRADGPEQT